ncbi:MAG: hypothetical protein HF975_04475 [ANME-2 cluster archaeon]|nr:hypothetical protein [ANME-2 cluster archaeon]
MATIVDDGLEGVARVINGVLGGTPAYTYFEHMALGSGSTAEANADTELDTEITTNGGARASATPGYEASNKSTWVHTYSFTGALAINECGIFDGATPGAANSNMLLRHVFAATKNVINGDQLQLTVKLTASR